MSLRIGFDMDGVLADFAAAFHAIEARLFPADAALAAGQPESEGEGDGQSPGDQADIQEQESRPAEDPRELRRRREAIWSEIRSTPDFWLTLRPTGEGAIRRIHELMLRHRWEVFFITQRPATAGDTVQRQTQRWLVAQGFDLPSVLVIAGSRGAAAAALRLDYHVDDSPQNCLDVIAAAGTRALLVTGVSDRKVAVARKLGIGVTHAIEPCLDVLDQVSIAHANPRLWKRLAARLGWK